MDREYNWIFSSSVTDYLDTVERYERVSDEQVYEFLELNAPTENDPEGVIELFIDREGVEIRHETDRSVEPLLDTLDRSYPPTEDDDLWIGDQTGYKRQPIGAGFGEDVHTFEFYRNNEPLFDLSWTDLTAHYDNEDYPAPYGLEISSFDPLGMSIDSKSTDPLIDFTLAGLRTDITDEGKGKMLRDLFQLLDYGLKNNNQSRMLDYVTGNDLSSFVDSNPAD